MKNIPSVGFVCVGDNALELSGAICCAGKLIKIFKNRGYEVGGCYSCICPSLQKQSLRDRILDMCAVNSLVVTVGGEGWRKSHVIPEITASLCSHGASYLSCALSCSDTSGFCDGTGALKGYGGGFTYPSRASAGYCGQTLIINLPSEPDIACRRLERIMPALTLAIGAKTGAIPLSREDFCSRF